jgi:oxalate decarboxylase/phosphoglucose isomerase-like protein (cupin superfamily)
MATGLSIRKPEEMQEVLADPTADMPSDLYYMIRRPGMNITVLPEYRLGKEYPKTYGHFHKPEAEETYQILFGEAAMLVQKGVDPVEEIKMIRLKRGDSITVPKGYAHCLINLGKGPVATLDDHGLVKFENDYEPIREKRGFAYYLVEDDEGRPRAILNSRYQDAPPLKYE